MNIVRLEVTDALTDEVTLINVKFHEAQKLYRALREIFGDAQYQAQPMDLVTVPDVRISV